MNAPLALPQDAVLLGRLPDDRPFLAAEAAARGVDAKRLHRLLAGGLLRRPLRRVYVAAGLEDTLPLRLSALRLVVPSGCVVTDRTAAWLWAGDRMLAPNDHLAVPRLHVFAPPGRRLRNSLVDSGERMLAEADVTSLEGVLVTTPLRTACDLGRLLHRDQALGALDVLSALPGASPADIARAVTRYKGYRGVIQLRSLLPLADPRCRWPSESILRLRWYDAGLPRPVCQIEVPTPWGTTYTLDVGLPALKYAAEYDGEAYHGADRHEHDEARRDWLRHDGSWVIVVLRRDNVHGPGQDAERLLREGYELAERTAGARLGR